MTTTTIGPIPPPPRMQALDLSQTMLNLDAYAFIRPSEEQMQTICAQLNATLQFVPKQDSPAPRQPGTKLIQFTVTRASKRGQCNVQIEIHDDASGSITKYRNIDIRDELLQQAITTAANLVEGYHSETLARAEEAQDYFEIIDQVIAADCVCHSETLANVDATQNCVEIIAQTIASKDADHHIADPAKTATASSMRAAPAAWQLRYVSPVMFAQCIEASKSATTPEERSKLLEKFCEEHHFHYWQLAKYFKSHTMTLRQEGEILLARTGKEPHEACSEYTRAQWDHLPIAQKTPEGRLQFCSKFNLCPLNFNRFVTWDCRDTKFMANSRRRDAGRNTAKPAAASNRKAYPIKIAPKVTAANAPHTIMSLNFLLNVDILANTGKRSTANTATSTTTATPTKTRRMDHEIITLN